MTTLLLSFLLFAAFVGVLAFLVERSGRPLKGSCGGVGGSSCACRNDGLPEGSCGDDPADSSPIRILPR